MPFIPPGEHIVERKKCAVSGEDFFVTNKDLEFYDKVSPVFGGKKYSVPSPLLSPDERKRRRFVWRNERKLYHRKCDLSGKQMISIYDPSGPITTYDIGPWFSDDWTAADYGREVSFDHPFFEQFNDLDKSVPQLGISVWNSENSGYCNYVGHVKNSYLIFGSVYSEDCLYGSPYYSEHCVDTLVVRDCEYSYECIDSRELNGCFWCQDCHSSTGLIHCFDCKGCQNCIGCAGLRNQSYHIFNKQVTKEQYEEYLKDYSPLLSERGKHVSGELKKIKSSIPHKYYQGESNENVTGNYIFNCKNVHESFYADRSEDSRFCQQVVDLRDCYDNNFTEENSWCLDYLGAYDNQHLLFSRFCNKVGDGVILNSCFSSHDLFGCSGLKSSEYCVLNKSYSKFEYEDLCGKLIDHMRSTEEWGEFFPHEMSPFGYNETVAAEYFPTDRDEIQRLGWTWKDDDETTSYHGDFYSALPIDQYDESVVGQKKAQENIAACVGGIHQCSLTHRPFKIIKQELLFYIQNKLPIPTVGPDKRHDNRMQSRNPRKLWEKGCDGCDVQVQTTYGPNRPERILCESCYHKTAY